MASAAGDHAATGEAVCAADCSKQFVKTRFAEPAQAAEPSVEDLVTQLMGQIKNSDWVKSAEPLGVNIFDLAAAPKAEREAAEQQPANPALDGAEEKPPKTT